MRILIVDDHALVRRGMSHVVKEGFPEADVIEADAAARALDRMREKTVDVVLIDVRPPGAEGSDLLRSMKAEWPDVPVIMLSTHHGVPNVKRALADGASGYLLRDATPGDLTHAIAAAMSGGGNILSPHAIQSLFNDAIGEDASGSGGSARRNEFSLTARENDILALLAEGKSNREMARGLYLSEKTVKAHLAAIFRKLGVTNRTQAAMAAVQMGVEPVAPRALAQVY